MQMMLCGHVAQDEEKQLKIHIPEASRDISPWSAQEAPGTEAGAQRSEAHNILQLLLHLSQVKLPGELLKQSRFA